MAAQQNHSEGEMNKCGATLDAAIPSGHNGFELVKPGACPLNLPPLLVSAQWAAVLTGRLAAGL